MEYAQLGSSSLKISRLGFGSMSLKENNQESKRILDKAVSLGINYFDTADLYEKGLNETIVGSALRKRRKEIILATKVGNQWKRDGSGWDWNPTKKYILQAVEESLKRLQTDYIDLYQLHGGTLADPIDETIEAFELLKKQGKIRYYGISSIRPNVIKLWLEKSALTSIMLQYSLLDRRPEELFPLIRNYNVGIIARGPLAQGLLINKPAVPVLDHSADQVEKAKLAINKIGTPERNPVQAALQFVLHHPEITTAVVGIRTMKQLDDALIQNSTKHLSEEDFQLLNHTIQQIYYKEHRI